MAIKLSSLFTIVFLLLVLQETILFSAMADMKFIQDTCKSTPNYDLCVKTILADPKSQDADLTNLALIVVNAIKEKGINTINYVKSLESDRPELKSPLEYCANVYNAIVTADVPEAVTALTQGNPKFAEDGVADCAVESQACESTFGQYGQASPMTNMNKDMGDLANVARALIRMLL
ncbi:cell wall / vacuolar inhibitor of fructosidase 1-like [Cynara cardunculus var. scolymus]|uniref:Pectinesterase inhibitor n=1 Tax=Cynara cardunculus var. scolymus TaxID=59895 RepID=A0A103XBA4_CYNCS|nr:cell wall / vacuolar inhibitor of fructosidase 1-like [Cynara cardunculus var. scolymus]KVH87560.1 Pectinesterase inhibitor [Cynara cardunculus var. scolymus]